MSASACSSAAGTTRSSRPSMISDRSNISKVKWNGRPRIWLAWKAPYLPRETSLQSVSHSYEERPGYKAHRGYRTYVLGTIFSTLTASEGRRKATYWPGWMLENIVGIPDQNRLVLNTPQSAI